MEREGAEKRTQQFSLRMTIGLESWFYNFSQLSRRWNSPDTLADIPRPQLEFTIWGFLKGGEIASVIGGLIVHPIYRIYLKKQLTPDTTTPNSMKIIRNKCRRIQGRFLIAGLLLGPAAAMLYTVSHPEDEMRRQCYRIRCDQPMLVYDRMAFAFGFIGWYWKRFQGAVDGINLGLAYALVNNNLLAPYTSPLLVDKVRPEEQYRDLEEAQKNKSMLTKFMIENDERERKKVEK